MKYIQIHTLSKQDRRYNQTSYIHMEYMHMEYMYLDIIKVSVISK